MTECKLLIPMPDHGRMISIPVLDQWERELVELAGGFTVLPGLARGAWKNPEGELIWDRSRVYLVAVRPGSIEDLRQLARRYVERFGQECLYFAAGSSVELLGAEGSNLTPYAVDSPEFVTAV